MKSAAIIAAAAGILLLPLNSFAWRNGKPVIPYGDFCTRCGQYGYCKKIMSYEDAAKAMAHYFHRKGLKVEIDNRKTGRFIRARIKDDNDIVDIIIFDRRTGRMRSIY